MSRRLGTKVASCFADSNYDDDTVEEKLAQKMNLTKTRANYTGNFNSDQVNVGRHFTGNSRMRNLHSFKNELKELQTERKFGASRGPEEVRFGPRL